MKKLLQLLEEDCTLTHEQLASLAGMTNEEVDKAIKEYEEDKTILGYQAIIDWDRVKREAVTALIEVKVMPQRNDGFDRIAERRDFTDVHFDAFGQPHVHDTAFDRAFTMKFHNLDGFTDLRISERFHCLFPPCMKLLFR